MAGQAAAEGFLAALPAEWSRNPYASNKDYRIDVARAPG